MPSESAMKFDGSEGKLREQLATAITRADDICDDLTKASFLYIDKAQAESNPRRKFIYKMLAIASAHVASEHNDISRHWRVVERVLDEPDLERIVADANTTRNAGKH